MDKRLDYKSDAEKKGLERLRLKKAKKIPGSVKFNIDDRGIVKKVNVDDTIK